MYKQFIYLKNKEVKYEESDVIYSDSILSPGLYELTYVQYPLYKVVVKTQFIRNKSKIEHINSKYIDNIVDKFLDKKISKKLKSINMDNRFGILLYGDAGTGKSSIINDIIHICSNESLIFIISNKDEYLKECWDFITRIRESQNNNIIIIFDEFDEYMKEESMIKQIMDGQYSIDNCLFLMSTNYIDSIPDSIKDRPSRCKYRIKIEGIQDLNTIKNIISCLNLTDDEMEIESNKLKGLTLDSIKNYCIDRLLDLENFSFNRRKIGFSTKNN